MSSSRIILFVSNSLLGLLLFIPMVHAQVPGLYQGHGITPHGQEALQSEISPLATTETDDDGQVCTTITYEGVGDLSEIPEFDGITSPGWLALIDADAGGTGNFAFEPSPETIAFWLGGSSGTSSSRDILFTNPVSKFEFFYTSFEAVQIDAFDSEDNLLATASGSSNFNLGPGGDPTGQFNKWDLLEVQSDGNKISKVTVSGNVDQTGIDNLTVCQSPDIHSIEVTQAIQELQALEDLKADLAADREPPVPIVKGKPAVLRVYLNQIQNVTTLTVNVQIPGVINQSKSLTLQPQCTPELLRRGEEGCQSFDFYFVPPAGEWTATVQLFNETDMELDSHDLPFLSRNADSLVLRSVSICDERDASGTWQCEQGNQLAGMIDFLSRTAPTDEVRVSVTNHFVRRDLNTTTYDLNGNGDGKDCFDLDGNGTFETCEVDDWWTDTIQDVHKLHGLFDAFLELFGQKRFYYGVIRSALPGGTGGMVHGIPSKGAGSRRSAIRLGVETSSEVVAHETGHMLGRRHTNVSGPAATAGNPPGCYSTATDGGTDWPFSDNRIQSSMGLEVGFDVSARKPVLPEDHFDWMSYCTPRWISPHTYRLAMAALGAATSSSVQVRAAQTVGLFWLISGEILEDTVSFDPLFTDEREGPTDSGDGLYRIEVRGESGEVLFTRFFTLSVVTSESAEQELKGPPSFFEIVPVQPAPSQIVVVGPDGADLGSFQQGARPFLAWRKSGGSSTIQTVRATQPQSVTH